MMMYAGAPMARGSVRSSWQAREAIGRLHLKPQCTRTEDGGSDPSSRRGKCAVSLEVDAVRTKPRGQGVVDPESALTAEGSTRIPSTETAR
jgi:hypothetical protein